MAICNPGGGYPIDEGLNQPMQQLVENIKQCTVCKLVLPHGPRPVLSVSAESKILIIGQAPGIKVHESGIPWDDQSGKELRRWLGVNHTQFYNTSMFGIMPMGFCYPGKGTSGDLPPQPECAPLWHPQLLPLMPQVQLVLLIGKYAQQHYLGTQMKSSLTETVHHYQHYLPTYLPLVHPSPRNKIWQKKNPWFEEEVIPMLQQKVNMLLKIT